MNPETIQKISRPEFEALFQEVYKEHKPTRASFEVEHLAEIGRLVVRFARLEETMKIRIGWLMGGAVPSARVATSEASFRNLVSMLGALAYHHFGETEEVNMLLTAINDAEAIRNQVLHSLWFGGDGQTVHRLKFTAKPKKGVQESREGYSLDDLKSIVSWIEKIDTVVDGFILARFIETQKNLGPVSVEIMDGKKITNYPMIKFVEDIEGQPSR